MERTVPPSRRLQPWSRRYPRYVVQREDVMDIAFPIVPEFQSDGHSPADGYIALLNAGIACAGHDSSSNRRGLEEDIRQYAERPCYQRDLREFQKPFFVVSGQVGKPGKYTFRDGHDCV